MVKHLAPITTATTYRKEMAEQIATKKWVVYVHSCNGEHCAECIQDV